MNLFDVFFTTDTHELLFSVLASDVSDAAHVALRGAYEKGIPAVLADVDEVVKVRENVTQ
jgi:hypothetical protein